MTQADPTTDRLLVGNCLDTLKTLADASIDSIVTDPPYELGFMGKAWDASGIAYQVQLWAECLRVLKPGGYLLAFGGTRTYHRMAVAIEDAGFEIRDSIHWTYGSGFPKSMNVSIAIDKAAGKMKHRGKRMSNVGQKNRGEDIPNAVSMPAHKPITEAAKQWDGWGTALKPSHEPIVVARKPLDGTVADNVQQYGTGAINIDATRVGTDDTRSKASLTALGQNSGWNSHENKEVIAGSACGRFPANTLLTHNHDCQQTGTTNETVVTTNGKGFAGSFEGGDNDNGGAAQTFSSPTWSCTPGCPIELLDQQQEEVSRFFHNSQWSVADDLTPFIYQAKPGKKERNAGLEHLGTRNSSKMMRKANNTSEEQSKGFEQFAGAPAQNFHPTVKPVQLIRYLIKMVTPPKGTVLDPFLGSGTTGVAAILEGFEWKGCELTEDYLPIIKGRTTWATKEAKKQAKQPKQETLL
jgi:site-specific DNA-methyltransferase (adenine-specific)